MSEQSDETLGFSFKVTSLTGGAKIRFVVITFLGFRGFALGDFDESSSELVEGIRGNR